MVLLPVGAHPCERLFWFGVEDTQIARRGGLLPKHLNYAGSYPNWFITS